MLRKPIQEVWSKFAIPSLEELDRADIPYASTANEGENHGSDKISCRIRKLFSGVTMRGILHLLFIS